MRFLKFEGGNLQKFIVPEQSRQGMIDALKDFKDNKLKIHYKSAAVPAENNESVKIVVGDTFEELVLTQDKYVLLEAYAPWCGHCKKLEPIYKEMADKLIEKGITNVVIAKMDATENEHPLMPVQGFPTLRLFKPNDKTPVDYTGDRSMKDMLQFIKTHSKANTEVITDEL